MSDLFENVFDQRWMKTRTIQEYYGLNRAQKNKMKLDRLETLAPQEKINQEKYANRVKEYTSYAIGRKISKNTPTFTE